MPEYRQSDSAHEAVKIVTGTAIVVRGNDIDTDRIIPARYLKAVSFNGIGEFAFQDVRYDENGHPTDHPFNDPRFAGASVLIVNKNFGCGSSREHAPQAILRWGIKAIMGESFAEIFAGNCNALGVPAVTLPAAEIEDIMSIVEEHPTSQISIDLPQCRAAVGEKSFQISMPESFRQALIAGSWDSTAVLLSNTAAIRETAASLPYVGNFA